MVEILRYIEGTGVVDNGWIGGNAWLDSVVSHVEIRKMMKENYTFIAKNNTSFFPMKVLHKIIQARCGNFTARYWVVMNVVITQVTIYVLAYVWSQRELSCMISICGSTDVHTDKSLSHFEDNFGNVTSKEINWYHISHFLYK